MAGKILGEYVSLMGLSWILMRVFLCRIDREREPGTMEKR